MNEIVTKALEGGLFAALFCFLFFYMLRDSKQREVKYISVIEDLELRLKEAIKNLGVCEQIKNGCDENSRLGENILTCALGIEDDVKSIDGKTDAIKSELDLICSKERL